ncbi:hypothetical protein [uncultured Nostoc sp.]|uniref:hypothetical protein n=1 Tax=uncultured Nostoc sp. TaxID=340711 RepID=UPI0035CB9703
MSLLLIALHSSARVQRLVERKKERCLRRAIRCRPHIFSFVVRRSHLQMINCDA